MKNQKGKHLFFLCLFFLTFLFVVGQKTKAQANQLRVENEQHWETYGVGGTCISGLGSNIFVADVDGDGLLEIITGGYSYKLVFGSQTARKAPLNIWSWNGRNITLEKSHKWDGRIGCLTAGDANGDGVTEIFTAGSVTDYTGSNAELRIWRWDGETLTLKTSYEWADTNMRSPSSLLISDVDKDGTPEILTCGRYSSGDQSEAQLSIWHWNETSLNLKASVEWCVANVSNANSLYVYELNNDGVNEIITGGYAYDQKNSSGQLRIWHWNGEELFLKANEEWRLKDNGYGLTITGKVQGNTVVNHVKAGDVDGDGTPEIITGGFAYDGEKVAAQLRIWNWNGQTLTLEKSQEWTTQDTVEVRGISIADVDGDGREEIVTSGGSGTLGSFEENSTTPELAQLRVWSWDGTAMTLEQSEDWYIDEGAYAQNLATGDLDRDGVIEIVTVGCTYFSNMCDPGMRIWSIARDPSLPPYALLAVAGIAAAAIVSAVALLWLRKKRQ
jgi:hypothetical protein